MRKQFYFILIAVCLAVLFGYRMWDNQRTDTDVPQIHTAGPIPEISVAEPRSALLQGLTATDKTAGDVTNSLVVERIQLLSSDGQLMVSYAAFDNAGNVAKFQREARYTDYTRPRFSLNGPLLYSNRGSFDVLDTVTARDVIDGDIQHRIRATSLDAHSISQLGVHDVQFQVTNSLGDTVTYVFPVETYDPTLYDGELALTDYLVYLTADESFTPGSYLRSFTFRGEQTSLSRGLPSGYKLETKGAVDTRTPGVYPVEFRVTYTIKHETDPSKDQHYTAYSKLIVIVEG